MKITKKILINNKVNNRLNQTNNHKNNQTNNHKNNHKILLIFKFKTIINKSFGQKINLNKHRID
jgi:hypothetical protein